MQDGEFGRALRRWRDRVDPDAVGLPVGGRRRAAGLRREELAALAGISVDYLTRLEQGRATSPSDQVVEALTRALRLSDAEAEHLYRLAGLAVPGPGVVSTRIPASVQRLLDRFTGTPVVVFDATWTLLHANAPYEALMGASSALRGIERNSVWRNLVGPATRTVHTPEEHSELQAQLVGDLRATAARYPDDPRVARLVAELRSGSERFVELWDSGAVVQRGESGRHKVIRHPDVGPIALECDTLIAAVDDLRIMVYTAEPGTEDAERLALAVVLGTQRLVDAPAD